MKIITKQYNYIEFLKINNQEGEKICFITGIKNIDRSNNKVFDSFITKYKPIKSFVIYDNQGEIESNFHNVQCFKNDDRGNAEFIKKLLIYLKENNKLIDKCVIDASALNKETLLEVMYILQQFISVRKDIIYLTPKEYGDYLYDSYKIPYSMSFTPGVQLMGKKNILILLSGYEGMGEIALTRYIEPAVLYIGVADPSTEAQFFGKNKINRESVIAEFSKYEGIEIKDFIYSGNDIDMCTENIRTLFENNSELRESNLFIAPMNNKLTTLAVFNVWNEIPDMQIVDIRGIKKSGAQNEKGIGSVYCSTYENNIINK